LKGDISDSTWHIESQERGSEDRGLEDQYQDDGCVVVEFRLLCQFLKWFERTWTTITPTKEK